MKVPFLDLRASYLEMKHEIDAAVNDVLDSGWYILGSEVQSFEAEFAAYCETSFAVGLADGLDALHLGLKALDVGPGDEVIVPSNTYIATWLAVTQSGATIVPVEPDPGTHNLDAGLLENAITERTKVILPVHLYGLPADMKKIVAIARKHGIRVLEDAAQAHGARCNAGRIGGHGDVVAWSFYPSKNLGAMGDAGAVTTSDPDISDRIRILRNYGSRTRYVNEVCGYNSRLDPVQAAVLRVKLQVLDRWNSRRAQHARYYFDSLRQANNLVLPSVPQWADPAWHQFVVQHPRRDELHKALMAEGIETIIHYPIPPHLQQAYAHGAWTKGQFPIAEQLAKEVLSLPIGPHMKAEHQEYVIDKLIRECSRL